MRRRVEYAVGMPGWIGHATRTEEADFACARCGFNGRALVTAAGSGRATLLFDKPEKALVEAQKDARANVQRDIRRARCPKCGQRNPGQALWFWVPYLAATVAAVVLGYWYMPRAFYPVVVAGIPLLGWRGWSKLDEGIRWLN
jgi:hypothetical protein